MSPRDIQSLRASDADREAVVAILGDSHEEGRLSLDEMQDRVTAAYKAGTIGQLKNLVRDLPVKPSRRKADSTRPSTSGKRRKLRPRPFNQLTDGQKALRVLWTIWTSVVSVNLVIWFLATVSEGEPLYFWPLWVAGPAGAVLGTVSWFCRTGDGEVEAEGERPW
jgi:hypothetical protein